MKFEEKIKEILSEKINIKSKSKKDIIDSVKIKDKNNNIITVESRPSKNNYTEYTISIIDPDNGSIIDKKVVYLANEVFTYLNDKISSTEKAKLNVFQK